jgi:hypothetical protein
MIIPKIISLALTFQKKYLYDESHSLGHGINVFKYSNKILNEEIKHKPYLYDQRSLIYTTSILHDICDDKYVEEDTVLSEINKYLFTENILSKEHIDVFNDIVKTMSYSKVKKTGFPDLGIYNTTYHIVRESDLLAAYDFDRSLLYNIYNVDNCFNNSYKSANYIMDTRVLKHISDDLFTTSYAKKESVILEKRLKDEILLWDEILKCNNYLL